MAGRRFNPNRAKIHRSYTVAEVAGLYDVHRNTVRNWIKLGLPVCDDRRPTLILGQHLRDFLQTRKSVRKRRCRVDQLFCLRCREPQRPAGDMVDYEPMTAATGRLTALCPGCGLVMNRYVRTAGLAHVREYLDVSTPKPQGHIGDSDGFPLSSDFS